MTALMTRHHHVTPSSDGYAYDLHQTDHWKSLFADGGILSDNKRNLALAISLDGVNPFRKRSSEHSMWPVFVHILNLPQELRYSFDYSLLATVIPGPKCPSDLGAFFKPVFDELAQLFDKGLLLRDGTTVRAVVDLMVMDYQAQAKVLCMKAQGALQGCHLCTINGHYVHDLRKVVYLNNRAYIEPNDHPLRSASGYFSQQPNDLIFPNPEVTKTSLTGDENPKQYAGKSLPGE